MANKVIQSALKGGAGIGDENVLENPEDVVQSILKALNINRKKK